VASTKAYTSQFLALVLFGLVLSEDSISKDARRRDIIDGLQQLPDLIKSVLTCDKKIRDYAEELYTKSSLLVMGRGFNFATCLEGALVREAVDLEWLSSKAFLSIVESEGIDLYALRRHPRWRTETRSIGHG
jgi:glutamine---fructose-6-phosphate transaminase (isomerizing)